MAKLHSEKMYPKKTHRQPDSPSMIDNLSANDLQS